MSSKKKSLIWVVLGIVVVAGLVVFGGGILTPEDPEDAAMKVRRPPGAKRVAPGQIGVDSSTDPNAPSSPSDPDASDEPASSGGSDQ